VHSPTNVQPVISIAVAVGILIVVHLLLPVGSVHLPTGNHRAGKDATLIAELSHQSQECCLEAFAHQSCGSTSPAFLNSVSKERAATISARS
jgi:hypothetical protein